MKKNRMMRLGAILLVCVLMTTAVISGTFAKYTSETAGSDYARVAEWDIKLDGAQMQYTNQLTVDLFKTTYDETGSETVTSSNGEKLIAPGTQGAFDFTFKNESEVAAQYTLTAGVVKTDDIPVLFKIGNGEWITANEFVDEIKAENAALAINEEVTVAVEWKWIFEDNRDAADTALGLDGNDTITVNFALVVEQVN